MLARLRDSRLVGAFTSLVAAQVVGSVLGFLFWLLAAREVSAHGVGIAAAAISLQTLLSMFAVLGFGTLLIGELDAADGSNRSALVRHASLLTVLAGVVLGGLAVAAARWLGDTLHEALRDPGVAVALVLGCAFGALGLVLDHAALGVQRSALQVWRNLWAAGLRFPVAAALLAADQHTPSALMWCWVVPIMVSCLLAWRRLPGHAHVRTALGLPAFVRRYVRPALHHHALNLALSAGPMLVPVVASVVLAPSENAAFAIAWLMATVAFVPPYMLATALFAASVNQSLAAFRQRVRRTLPASLAMSVAIIVGTFALGPWVLRLFGGHYGDNSAVLLQLLVLGGVSMILKDHLVAYARVAGRLSTATRLAAVAVALEIAGTYVGGVTHGALGVTWGWLSALFVQAAVALPLVIRMLRVPEPEGSIHEGEREHA